MYGSECFADTTSTISAVNAAEMRILRRIHRVTRRHRIPNEQIRQHCELQPAMKLIRKRRRQYNAHISRRSSNSVINITSLTTLHCMENSNLADQRTDGGRREPPTLLTIRTECKSFKKKRRRRRICNAEFMNIIDIIINVICTIFIEILFLNLHCFSFSDLQH